MKLNLIIVLIVFSILSLQNIIVAQENSYKIGKEIEIKSRILGETRNVIVSLPSNYNETKKNYPVLYRLDGENSSIILETISTIERLSKIEEKMPEVITVAIKNINRAKDMWPVSTKYFTGKPGADNFLKFINQELIPYIDGNYRTSNERVICGQSLSAIFTMYVFLTNPKIFDSYLVFSLAFPDCDNYFSELTKETLKDKDRYARKNLFITNGLKDPLDPKGEHHHRIKKYSELLKTELGEKVRINYLTYEKEGHVPFFSLYDGIKYIYKKESNKLVE